MAVIKVVRVAADVRWAAFGALDAATLYALLRLRTDVFVVEQRCAYPELDGRDTDPETMHGWVDVDGAVAAYLRLLTEPGGERRIGRVCVAPGHRGSGLANQLVEQAVALAAGCPVILDAQGYLADWYARLGFVISGPEFIEDGIAHVPMRRNA